MEWSGPKTRPTPIRAMSARAGALGWSSALIIDGQEPDGNFKRAAANIPLIDVLPQQDRNRSGNPIARVLIGVGRLVDRADNGNPLPDQFVVPCFDLRSALPGDVTLVQQATATAGYQKKQDGQPMQS